MFVVMNRLSCPKDYGASLEQAFRYAGAMQGVQGFLAFQFLRNLREDAQVEYIALTQWQDRAAYEAWSKSESFARSHRAVGTLTPITATLESYEVLE